MTPHKIVDLSNWQGAFDFGRIPEVEGAILKATQGAYGGTNPYFDQQYASARAHGKVTGAYLFDDTSANPEAEAQTYINRVAGKTWELGHWFDFEGNYGGLNWQGVRDHITRVMNPLRAAFGMKAGMYSAPWAWNPLTNYWTALGSLPLWLACYTPSPGPSPAGFGEPLLWQYTDSYTGPHQLDMSYFMGSETQWQWLLHGTTPTPPKPVPYATKIAVLQAIVHDAATGVWTKDLDMRLMAIRAMKDDLGRKNPAAVRLAQQVMAFPPAKTDGAWGPVTHDSVVTYIRRIQTALGCPVNGTWDTATEFSFLVIDPLR